jgi:hypothetical protein
MYVGIVRIEMCGGQRFTPWNHNVQEGVSRGEWL